MLILPFAVPAAVAAGIYLIRKQREYSWGKFSDHLFTCCSINNFSNIHQDGFVTQVHSKASFSSSLEPTRVSALKQLKLWLNEARLSSWPVAIWTKQTKQLRRFVK